MFQQQMCVAVLADIPSDMSCRHPLLLASDFKLVLIATPDHMQEKKLTTLKACADPAQATCLSLPASATKLLLSLHMHASLFLNCIS